MNISLYPTNLVEAVETLEYFYGQEIEVFKGMEESSFLYKYDLTIGEKLRNDWFLWWEKDHGFDSWPIAKPELVKWFNSRMIVGAKQMTNVILKCLHRKIRGYQDWDNYDKKRRI